MQHIKFYVREIIYLRRYIILIFFVLLIAYSIYCFLDTETAARLGREDHLFEWLTAFTFLGSSAVFLLIWLKHKRAPVFIVLSLLFLLGFGEEISWGQRVINFDTPEKIKQLNVQKEFTIHNLEIFNTENREGERKNGINRIFEVNFLFKMFTIVLGVLLPVAVFHSKSISSVVKKLKFPVPPISITIFFAVNWIIFKVLLEFLLPQGQVFQFYDTGTEIFEFLASFIILVLAWYFYMHRHIVQPGYDIKQSTLMQDHPVVTFDLQQHRTLKKKMEKIS